MEEAKYRENKILIGASLIPRKAIDIIQDEHPGEILFLRRNNGVLYNIFTATEPKSLDGYKLVEKNEELKKVLQNIVNLNYTAIKVVENKEKGYDVYFK